MGLVDSRTSNQVNADPKDWVNGQPVSVANCKLTMKKKVRIERTPTPTSFVDADLPADAPVAHEGETATYRFEVKNEGTTPLRISGPGDVGTVPKDVFSDNPASTNLACTPVYQSGDSTTTGTVGRIDPGETWVYTCTQLLGAGPAIHDRAFVEGHADNCTGTLASCGSSANDPANVKIIAPALEIVKYQYVGQTPPASTTDYVRGPLTAHVGDTIYYRISVGTRRPAPR